MNEAEADDNFEGEYIDFLVPFQAIEALRAALAVEAPGTDIDEERLRRAIYTVSVRHNWAETLDTEDRTAEIIAAYRDSP